MANLRDRIRTLCKPCIALLIGLLGLTGQAQVTAWKPPRFERIFVFGDSLSDCGNVYEMTFHLYPGAPYWNGRFSNGPVWAEKFALRYNITLRPSLLSGGTDFAYGGAETGSGLSPDGTPNLERQRSLFAGSFGTFRANDLAVIWAGANDFFNGQTDANVPAQNIYNECVNMKNLGARWLLVGNLPALGFTPAYLGTPDEPVLNARSQAFNAALHSRLALFRAMNPNMRVIELDAAALFNQARNSPGDFGLTNVTQAYLDTNQTENPDTFMFWDEVHPSRVIHALLADTAYQSVALLPRPFLPSNGISLTEK